jgi:hypothetical protein
MKRSRPILLALVVMSGSLAPVWYAHPAHAASRSRVLAECNREANQRMLGAASIKKKNFVRDCMRRRGFSGPP